MTRFGCPIPSDWRLTANLYLNTFSGLPIIVLRYNNSHEHGAHIESLSALVDSREFVVDLTYMPLRSCL